MIKNKLGFWDEDLIGAHKLSYFITINSYQKIKKKLFGGGDSVDGYKIGLDHVYINIINANQYLLGLLGQPYYYFIKLKKVVQIKGSFDKFFYNVFKLTQLGNGYILQPK